MCVCVCVCVCDCCDRWVSRFMFIFIRLIADCDCVIAGKHIQAHSGDSGHIISY